MPSPEKPDLEYSFTAFQQAQGTNEFPGTQIDAALASLKAAIDETIDFASIALRSDGKLQNGIVAKSSLDSSVQIGIAPPTPWATAAGYLVDDTVSHQNSLYIALADHTAGTFATDLANGLWALVADFSTPIDVADGSVTEPKHATGGVSTRALADASVVAAKVPDGALPIVKLDATAMKWLVPIGAEIDFGGVFAPSGWLFKYGQSLSRTVYAGLLDVIAPATIGDTELSGTVLYNVGRDFRNLGVEGSPIEGAGIPGGTTIVSVTVNAIQISAAATAAAAGVPIRIFPYGNGNGTTTFDLPDDRDRVLVGRGNMGGAGASRITASGAGTPGINTARLGAGGGVDRHATTLAETATHDHTAFSVVSDPTHAHVTENIDNSSTTAGGGGLAALQTGTTTTNAATTGITVATGVNGNGGGQAHQNVQPSRVSNKIIFTGVF